jgi:hypothetical protein
MKTNTYIVYWLTGESTKITGKTPVGAFRKAGIGNGAVSAIDFYEEADEPTYAWVSGKWVPITQTEQTP